MEFSQFLAFCTFCAIIGCTYSEGTITNLSAVNARTVTMKTIYSRARNTQDQVQSELNKNQQNMDSQTRDRICSSIMARASEFGGDIYKSRGELFEALRITQSTFGGLWTVLGVEMLGLHLRHNITLEEMTDDIRGDILANLIKARDADSGDKPRDSYSTSPEKSSSSVNTSPVLVNNPVDDKSSIAEDGFICSRWIDENEVQRYFVSREYNVNFASDSLTKPIIARFLFTRGANDHYNLRALAEEPAKSFLTLNPEVDIEDLYIERRTGKFPAASASEDRICALNERQRFRLGGQIFNSEFFEGKLTFPASYSVIWDCKCQESIVTLRRRTGESGKVYNEWMTRFYISYTPYYFDKKQQLTYFVSQAYSPDTSNSIRSNDIFLYGVENGEIFLINMFTNVRLDEIPKAEE